MVKKMRFVLCLAMIVALMFTISACTSEPPASSGGGGSSTSSGSSDTSSGSGGGMHPGIDASDDLYIGIYAITAIEYFYDHKIGLELAGQAYGVQTEFLGPADYNLDEMVNTLEQSIARKPDGLIVCGFDNILTPGIDKAMDQGVPVVTVDADLPDSKRLAFTGTGNYGAGQMCAEALVEMIGGKGKVAIVGQVLLSNINERAQGCISVFEQYPDIEFIDDIVLPEGDDGIAATKTAAMLQKYPDLAGICSLDGNSGGVATAIRESGKAGEIKVVAFDRSENVLNAIEEGWMSGTVVQQTALMPWYALTILYNLKHFDIPITTNNDSAGITGLPSYVDTGCVLVTMDNLEYFKR